ncbi:hypothetical protein ACFQUU_06165 [Herbaspirillum sp. GCM10030257]|uniref:hypothetical protein n=1 Tax=Herbaspirillum sp. GCM10030257 TaxID=3273393 RepID=UPI00360AC33E
MWKWFQRGAEFIVISTVISLCVIVLLKLLSFESKIIWSEEAAGWVQAIGSILAIGVAIWVSHDQHVKQQGREQARETYEVSGILFSLRGELESSLAGIKRNIGTLIEVSPGPEFNVTYPLPEDPFVIYAGLIPKLGMIPDHVLRTQIIETYAKAKSLVLTFIFNNQLVEEHALAKQRAENTKQPEDIQAQDKAWNHLKTYGITLRSSYRSAMSDAEQLLIKLPKP